MQKWLLLFPNNPFFPNFIYTDNTNVACNIRDTSVGQDTPGCILNDTLPLSVKDILFKNENIFSYWKYENIEDSSHYSKEMWWKCCNAQRWLTELTAVWNDIKIRHKRNTSRKDFEIFCIAADYGSETSKINVLQPYPSSLFMRYQGNLVFMTAITLKMLLIDKM